MAEVPVLECSCCAGLWLGDDAFKQVTEKAATEAIASTTISRPGRPRRAIFRPERERRPALSQVPLLRRVDVPPQLRQPQRRDHRRLPRARRLVRRQELPRIVNWIRAGGEARAEHDLAAEEARRKELEQAQKQAQQRAGWAQADADHDQTGLGIALGEAIASLLRL